MPILWHIQRMGIYRSHFGTLTQVWKIDRNTGDIIWRFGENGDFRLQPDELFQRQHAAYINRHGNLMIFDNGTTKRKYSSVKSFALNEQSLTAKSVLNITLSKDMFAARMGSAYMIDDTYILVCRPLKDVLLAIYNTDGLELWKVRGTLPSYRAVFIDANEIENTRPF